MIPEIQIQLLEKPKEFDGQDWEPRMPSHAYGGQHESIGLDFYSPVTVSATTIGHSSDPDLYSVTYSDSLKNEDIESLMRELGNLMNTPHYPKVFASPESYAVKINTNSANLYLHALMIRSGIKMGFPPSYHMQLASRSGLFVKNRIIAFPGIIDSSYTGEIIIGLYQFTENKEPFVVNKGDKIVQGIVMRSLDYTIKQVDNISRQSLREDKGFGSSS